MNETAITVMPERSSLAEVKASVNLIQQVMKDVMQDGTHYGKIPGTQSPTLLKAGAEKIMATFRLAADPEIFDLSTEDEARFRIKVRMSSPSGVFVGAGIGECSSSEEKYKWIKAVCDDEWESTPEDLRRIKWKKAYGKQPYKVKQIRSNIADLRNTVLKMAKKRALVDAVLTATAASDIFSQDLEDMPDEIRESVSEDVRPAGVREMENDHPEKPALVQALEKAAKSGLVALQKAWGELTPAQRNIIGADFGRIKKLATEK